MAQPLWTTGWCFLKKFKNPAIPLLGAWTKTTDSRDSFVQVFVHHVRSSYIIHNSQKAEASQVSINIWMYKRCAVCPHNGMLLDLQQEGRSDPCHSMDEPGGHCTQWNKPGTKDKSCMTPLRWSPSGSQIHRDRKQDGRSQGLGTEGTWGVCV